MNPADEQQLFELLDRYVTALHGGDTAKCRRWLAEYPQLAALADCLDALDRFAADGPAASGGIGDVRRGSPDPAEGATEGLQKRGRPAVTASGSDHCSSQRCPDRPQLAGDAHLAATIVGDESSLEPSSSNGASPPATDFGKYELIEEIGRGGMGVVFKARQRDLNRVVALKMILSNRLAGDDDVKRFYREARAAGRVRHPQIVAIHDIGETHGQHYFAMDFIAGTSLAALTRQGPLEPERAARCLAAVARAVHYLHEHGIIHRDLKPSNILLDEAGTPFVTDFGLAKVFSDEDERTQTGVILGTAGYMPPEQAAGRVSDTSPRSDVYSLGAILYETLTGRPPFREDNQLNTLLQVLEGEPTLPRQLNTSVPPELERICVKCLEKAPERRYASAAALASDLDRYLRCEEIEARPAGLADRIRRWVRRETGLAARLAIMAAVATIFQVAHWLQHQPWDYHWKIKIAFVVWAVLAFVFQRLLRREKTAEFARLAWAVTDPVILTFVLCQLEDVGPNLVGYPVLIVASGLWFSMRLVMISTVACVVSYTTLIAIRQDPTNTPHYPLIFMTALVVIAGIVAFQVHRIGTLSRYFEQTQPPDGQPGQS